LPLNRLRTRLSIPLGLRHAASRHLNLSLWWRMKPLVPVCQHARQHPSPLKKSIVGTESSLPASKGACGVVGGSANQSVERGQGSRNVRFFTIGMCFLAATICAILLEQGRNGDIELAAVAGGSNCTLTVLLSGDGQIWRRHDQDLPWEKFQKLVPAGGLRVVRKLLRLGGQCARPNPLPAPLAAGVGRR
jgi:hypothetical protein